MKALINNTEFEINSYNFVRTNGVTEGIIAYFPNTTIDEIAEAAGEITTFEVPNEAYLPYMTLRRATKVYNAMTEEEAKIIIATFEPADVRIQVNQNSDDIAVAYEAIGDLAKIIGE